MLDRSPCGSGTAAIVASHWSKGQFEIGNSITEESLVLCLLVLYYEAYSSLYVNILCVF